MRTSSTRFPHAIEGGDAVLKSNFSNVPQTFLYFQSHQLSIHRKSHKLTFVSRRISDVSHGSRLDDVPHDELLDRLVLGAATAAVGAADEADVSASLLVSSVVPSLDSHDDPTCNTHNRSWETDEKRNKQARNQANVAH